MWETIPQVFGKKIFFRVKGDMGENPVLNCPIWVRSPLLEQKILMHFGDKLKAFIYPTIGVGKIVFKSTVSIDEALSTKFDAVKENSSEGIKQYK